MIDQSNVTTVKDVVKYVAASVIVTVIAAVAFWPNFAPARAPERRGNTVVKYHDSAAEVTCWILNGASISCVPDDLIRLHGDEAP